MSRLSDLYKAMETLRKEGVSTEDLEQKVGSLEEDIIKKEIEQPNIEDMNLFYYNKYHSVYLAKKATEKRVMDYYNRRQSEIKKGKTVLPIIKDKNKIKIVENNKKAESVKKNEYKRLMDSFGFTRKRYKNQFLY